MVVDAPQASPDQAASKETASGPATPHVSVRALRQVRSRIRGGAWLLRATVDTGLRASLAGLVVILVAVAAGLWTAQDGAAKEERDVASTQAGPEVGRPAETEPTAGPTGDPGRPAETEPTTGPTGDPGPPRSRPTVVGAPVAPTALSAEPGNATVRLCWVASPGADAYTLFYRDVTTGQGWVRMPYPIQGPCYTAQQLVNGRTYGFRITGSNSAGESDPSNTVAVEPMAPVSLSAPTRSTLPDRSTSQPQRPTLLAPPAPSDLRAETGNATVRLCWVASPGADAYTLFYRDVTTGQGRQRMPYPIQGPCYTAQQLVNGQTYEFWLTASNYSGESGFSMPVTVTLGG
ncbi:hypothetical protein MXD63_34575 [Frankia sp. Cpl3]|nr:hypothetical protein [Frankia sp. Cpl3]